MMINRRSFLAGAAALALPALARSAETARGRSIAEFGVLPNTGEIYSEVFQKAVEEISAMGQPVYIPAGTYIVNAVVLPSSKCVINGEPGRTVLQPARSGGEIFVAWQSEGLEITGTVFEGREYKGLLNCLVDPVLRMRGGSVTVCECDFRNMIRTIYARNVSATFSMNRFYDCGSPLIVERARRLLVSQCRFENCGSNFVESCISADGQNIQLADNVISGSEFGISVKGDGDIRDNIISGPGAFDEVSRSPARIESRGMMLGGAIDDVYSLSVRRNTITGCEVGIGVARDARWLSITNNMITGALNGAIRPLDRYRLAGPDLALESAQDYAALSIADNVVR
jgi:hypothetical protein